MERCIKSDNVLAPRNDLLKNNNLTLRVGHYFYAGPGAWGLGNLSDGDENGKKATGLDKQNNDFARVSRFFVHFISVTVRFRITT